MILFATKFLNAVYSEDSSSVRSAVSARVWRPVFDLRTPGLKGRRWSAEQS
jgi:hypothetical protein